MRATRRAVVLNVGYVEVGPASGRPVILMHGFPYDIHSYMEVAPLLASEGYRAIVPYSRGYGTTTFRSSGTRRNADQASFALDILALMDSLKIDRAILAGYDWGSRTGDIIAALWPKRVKALVSVSGYLITNLAANKQPLPPAAENAWWYQYYFCTPRGVLGLNKYATSSPASTSTASCRSVTTCRRKHPAASPGRWWTSTISRHWPG